MHREDRDTVGSPKILDLWTVVHFVSGVAAFFVLAALGGLTPGSGFIIWMLLHLAYEIKDFVLAYAPGDARKRPNSWQNSMGDQLAAAVGYGLAAAASWSPRRPMASALTSVLVWGLTSLGAYAVTG